MRLKDHCKILHGSVVEVIDAEILEEDDGADLPLR